MNKIDKKKLMEQTLAALHEDKSSKDLAIGRYKDFKDNFDVDSISTGSIAADIALGGEGFPRNRLIELVGASGSGKTSLALTAIASLQRKEPEAQVVYIDCENALDPQYIKSLGVDLDNLIIAQPSDGDAAYDLLDKLIPASDLIVFDSIPTAIPRDVINGDVNDQQPGTFAKFVTKNVSKVNSIANDANCTVIFINHWKPAVSIGMFAPGSGQPNRGNMYAPGGYQLPFYMSQIIEIKPKSKIKDKNGTVNTVVSTITAIKNRAGRPLISGEMYYTFGKGIDLSYEMIPLGVDYNIIKKTGGYITFPAIDNFPEKIVNGLTKAANFLDENHDYRDALRKVIQKKAMEEANENGTPVNTSETLKNISSEDDDSKINSFENSPVTGDIINI